jgi:hypothetical protein
MNIVEEKRIGRFTIGEEILRAHPEVALLALEKCLVTRAEFIFTTRGVEYLAFSEAFDPADDSCQPPFYTPMVMNHWDEETATNTVTFEGFQKVG